MGRAAEVRHLFHEGKSRKIGSRLGMSVAWTLGEGPEQRERIIRAMKTVYDLRSRRVHGAVIGSRDVTAGMTESVILAARLLRRAIVARVLLAGDEAGWKRAFSSARLGALPDRFDQGAGCHDGSYAAFGRGPRTTTASTRSRTRASTRSRRAAARASSSCRSTSTAAATISSTAAPATAASASARTAPFASAARCGIRLPW